MLTISGGIVEDEEKEYSKEGEKIEFAREKRYNNLWDFLTKTEQSMLYDRIAGLKLLNNSEKKMANGNYLLDVKNLMIETNGELENPSIESITEFDYFTGCITEARIYFYENVNNGNRIEDSVEIVNDLCSKEVLHFYSKSSGKDYFGLGEQRRHFEQIGENSSRNTKRRRVLDKNRKFRNLHVNEEENVLEIEYDDGIEKIPLKNTIQETEELNGIVEEKSNNKVKFSRKSKDPMMH